MDLSKPCDCLSHDLLIAKLVAYGLDRSTIRLLMDYLNSRKQQRKVGASRNKWSEIKLRIPQGFILGTLLFNIFMNDLFLVVGKSDIYVILQMIIICTLVE